MGFTYVLGRGLFGAFFLYNGINHLKEQETLQGYAAAKQVPCPDIAVQLSGVTLAACGFSLMFGLKPRFGSLGIVAFLLAASYKMHDFWNQEDPGQKQGDMIHFSKNMALLGAALALGEEGD